MVSKVAPGATVLDRMGIYRLFAQLSALRDSYAGKFALAAFVGSISPPIAENAISPV